MDALSWQFEFFDSAQYWIALAACVAVVRSVGPRPRARAAVLLAASAPMLLAIPRFGPRDLLLVAAVSLVTFAAGIALSRPPRSEGELPSAGGRRWISAAAIATIVAFLAFFKYRFLQDLLRMRAEAGPPQASQYLSLLGISYFSFRALHVVIETYRRKIRRLDPLAFFAYMIFFPAFVSGPIARYPQFTSELAATRRPWKQEFARGGRRIVDGLFKKVVLVTLVFPHVLPSQPAALAGLTPGGALLGLWAHSLYFYFDFSGYSDLAIGSARLMGIELPENFDRPLLQKNIRDLWASWHMSLTSWLVDYVYWPVVRLLRNLDFFRPRPILLSAIGMNVTFVACGMWHGEALHFVAWGVYHGVGISAVTVYQRRKRSIRHPALQRYFDSRLSRWIGAAVTFNFFALGLALFVLDSGQLRRLALALTGVR
jgi:alginate O-acetyltransferase complex protein AlgI